MMLIGLSLSSCVSAIADGEVAYEDVLAIFSSTKAASEVEWEKILRHYAYGHEEDHKKPGAIQFSFWRNKEAQPARGPFPARAGDPTRTQKCLAIAHQLIQEGKVFQPRLEGKVHPRHVGFEHTGLWIQWDDSLEKFQAVYDEKAKLTAEELDSNSLR